MGKILAIVTMNKDSVAGGAPIFIAATPEEQKMTAFRLEKILDASVHDLQNGQLIVVEHESGRKE
ncbi:capping complex subunit for YIEGIA [Gorillibacterium sp. sgz5001074]|uniref:capping complex subunit for YIEGIA n=1 Tax=Gorillibacterium sp. sgz5001074 TaxID=3446695 RepID=UPI003F66AA2A